MPLPLQAKQSPSVLPVYPINLPVPLHLRHFMPAQIADEPAAGAVSFPLSIWISKRASRLVSAAMCLIMGFPIYRPARTIPAPVRPLHRTFASDGQEKIHHCFKKTAYRSDLRQALESAAVASRPASVVADRSDAPFDRSARHTRHLCR